MGTTWREEIWLSVSSYLLRIPPEAYSVTFCTIIVIVGYSMFKGDRLDDAT